MADEKKTTAPAAAPKAPDEFRRKAALEILGAFVARHGGFEPEAMEAHIRLVWKYADVFVALENAAPPAPPEAPAHQPRVAPARPARRAHPTDEWGVRDGNHERRGFVTYEEAEFYASARPGAAIFQVAGPEVQRMMATA